MRYRILLSFFVYFFIISVYAQEVIFEEDSIVCFTLYITDTTNTTLQEQVYITSSDTTHVCQTNAEGQAEMCLPNNQLYEVYIPNCKTFYEVNSANIRNDRVDLVFPIDTANKYVATAINALAHFNVFNLPEGQNITLAQISNDSIIGSFAVDTSFSLPINQSFSISINDIELENATIQIDTTPENLLYYVIYIKDDTSGSIHLSNNEAFLNVIYSNISNGDAVSGEYVEVIGAQNYSGTTSANGTCLFRVPRNDTYTINVSTEDSVLVATIGNSQPIYPVNCRLSLPSTNQVLETRRQDSVRLAERNAEFDKEIQSRLTEERVTEDIEQTIAEVRKHLQTDTSFFSNHSLTIPTIFSRQGSKWENKMVVTDLTESMYPYVKELLVWHGLKLLDEEQSDFVFFNDGDGKPNAHKQLGKTGGIYFEASGKPKRILSKAMTAMQAGDGGDDAENDVEALLFAQDRLQENVELILVADNYSPIKDIALIRRLQHPVRIVLCGTSWGIHPHYLRLAHETNGSVHTIEEDIYKLGEMLEGESVIIGKNTYVFSNGRFYKQ